MTTATIRDHEIENIDPALLARIRKMLAVAEIRGDENPENREGEIANAAAMASRMMAELNISMDDIESLNEEARALEEQNKRPMHVVFKGADSNIEMQWKNVLISELAEANFCTVLTSRSHHFYIIGRPHNVAMVNELIAFVVPQVKEMSVYASGHRKKTGNVYDDIEISRIPTPTYRLSYCMGVASRLGQRLRQQRHTDEVELQGTKALVLDTTEANREYMKTQWPSVFGDNAKTRRSGRGPKGNQTDQRAWGHGYNDGDKVSTSVGARRVASGTMKSLPAA